MKKRRVKLEIKANLVKELREKTGVGMMDCKKALLEAGGDFAKAVKILKGLGLAAAAKRAGRATNEGRIFIEKNGPKAVIAELSCETDFVAKNADFKTLGKEICINIIEKGLTSSEDQGLKELINTTIGKIKENITLKRFKVLNTSTSELFSDYIHDEGRIGVIVKLALGEPALKENEKIKELAFNLALHVAAFAPSFISSSMIDKAYIQEQEEIFWKQARGLDKPENVLEGIVKGKMKKHFSEICFLEQNYVRDEKIKVQQVINNISKEVATGITIVDFVYYKVGQ
jgi:elongation factor Ts